MEHSAHQAAVDQAKLLVAYLDATPSSALDIEFIQRHLDAIQEFAQAANTDPSLPIFDTALVSSYTMPSSFAAE